MILTIKMDLSRFLLHLPLWLQIVLLEGLLRLLLHPLKVGKPGYSKLGISGSAFSIFLYFLYTDYVAHQANP